MMPNHTLVRTRRRGAVRQLVVRLLRDDSGVTSLQYFVAVAVLALAVVAASRPIASVVASFLYRIHVITMLARP